ncbi:MAG: D-alanyl-D-alanine carboxypeptidase [Lentisphaeria bacterium]|nr:D-alanyl-D-alanine carboxypeptidase [Lentisphaeria bacterium]
MSGLNEITRTRLWVFGIILGVIILIHAIVIACVTWSGRPGGSGRPAGLPAAKEQTSPAQPLSASGAAVQQKTAQLPPPAVAGRYRNPVKTSWFGKPFSFRTAVRGNLPKMPHGRLARSGFLVDLTTRNVLWCKDERRSVPVASMAKMMTLLTAFETLEKTPAWSLDMPVQISRATARAAREGIIWLDARETLPLRDLMKAAAIKSANDAAYQIAEVAGNGSVDNFIAQMNRRAASLQMPGTRFMNPHGLPNRDGSHSVSSAMGMVILGERLLEYPDLMEWVGTQRTFIERPMVKGGKTELRNTNRLVVPRYPGVDGMKTGYTRAAGFCLTFSAVRDGRRLMGCVTGFPTAKERDIFARRLLDWGFLRAAEIAAGKTAPPSASAVTAPVQRKKR